MKAKHYSAIAEKAARALDDTRPPINPDLEAIHNQLKTQLDDFETAIRPALKTAWYINDPNGEGSLYSFNVDEGLDRLVAAFPDVPDFAELRRQYGDLRTAVRDAYYRYEHNRMALKRHKLRAQAVKQFTDALTTLPEIPETTTDVEVSKRPAPKTAKQLQAAPV